MFDFNFEQEAESLELILNFMIKLWFMIDGMLIENIGISLYYTIVIGLILSIVIKIIIEIIDKLRYG
jgi:hypothetical protein